MHQRICSRGASISSQQWWRRCGVQGQVMLEFAVSLVGLVSLIVISLNVWHWLGRTIVERQASFENTRKEAGNTKPGQSVPYHRPPIQLFKSPASIGGDGGLSEVPVPSGSDCPAGAPYFKKVKQLQHEIDLLNQTVEAEARKAEKWGHKAEYYKTQLEQCDSDDDACIKHWSDLIKEAGQKAKHHSKAAEDAGTQIEQKTTEMTEAAQKGDELCNPPDPPPSTD